MWLRMGARRMRIDGQPRDMITTVLDGLTQLTADDCEVVYSRGANVIDLVPDPAGEFYPDGQPRPKIGVSAAVDQAMIDEAVANAPQSDLIVAVVGDVVQLPVYYNQIRGQHGDRYADLTQDPAFAFGEGLSYTTFAYGEPTITGGSSNADGTFAEIDTVRAEITLTNTGERAGVEIVQAYISDIVTSYSWTDRELKAFQRVALEPGEIKTVTFEIPVANCTIVDPDANRIVEPGEFELLIGHSSRREDRKRTTFTVA